MAGDRAGMAGNWAGHRAGSWMAKAGGWMAKAHDGKWQVRDGGWRAGAGEHRMDGFAAALAKELGVPQEKVTAALEKVREQRRDADKPKPPANRMDWQAQLKQRLDQAVKDGKLTQAEADAITKAFTDHAFGGAGEHLGK